MPNLDKPSDSNITSEVLDVIVSISDEAIDLLTSELSLPNENESIPEVQILNTLAYDTSQAQENLLLKLSTTDPQAASELTTLGQLINILV